MSRLLVGRFSELCEKADLRPSEAVEDFMRRCIEVGDVEAALALIVSQAPQALLARELKAKALLNNIKGLLKEKEKENYIDYGEFWGDYNQLLNLLPNLKDQGLIKEIKALSKKVNKFLREP